MADQLQGQKAIVAVIPCFNEERFIGSVVLKARRFVDQVIVVDDGSSDGTAEIAEAAGATVLRHSRNKGKGVALNTAFSKLRELGPRAAVFIDGDAQHEPKEIPALLKPILEQGIDVTFGSRFLGQNGHIPTYRQLGQRILNVVTNTGSKVRLTDSQSGFKAFSPRAINVLNFQQDGFGVESEIQFLVKKNNLRVKEVPISAIYQDKAKRSPLAQGATVFGNVLGLISQSRPLLFFTMPGTVVLSGGIVTGIIVVKSIAGGGALSVGYTMVSILLCIAGLLLINTGILLNSISSLLSHRKEKE